MRKIDVYFCENFKNSFYDTDTKKVELMINDILNPENDTTDYYYQGEHINSYLLAEMGYIEPIENIEERNYSPSNPWDAPGMSIKDFI